MTLKAVRNNLYSVVDYKDWNEKFYQNAEKNMLWKQSERIQIKKNSSWFKISIVSVSIEIRIHITKAIINYIKEIFSYAEDLHLQISRTEYQENNILKKLTFSFIPVIISLQG